MITSFTGQYAFLSNFSYSPVPMAGVMQIAETVEHAYQCEKMTCLEHRLLILGCATPGSAKRNARQLPCRPDWESIKVDVMAYYLNLKFLNHPALLQKLLQTGDAQLIEGNTWGDQTWGCIQRNGKWVGRNILGELLMGVRKRYQSVPEILFE